MSSTSSVEELFNSVIKEPCTSNTPSCGSRSATSGSASLKAFPATPAKRSKPAAASVTAAILATTTTANPRRTASEGAAAPLSEGGGTGVAPEAARAQDSKSHR